MADYGGVYEKGEITLSQILESLHENPRLREAGAIASFIGIVRGRTYEGKEVAKLEVEAYKEKANEVIARICGDLLIRAGVMDARIYHFTGSFNVSDDLVYVIVAGRSRKDVFPALIEAVERYKKELPVWKKEILADGSSYWVSEKE
jgi:molybdopterin synthase catalytic subunit